MGGRRAGVVVGLALTALPGCEYSQRFVNKPWGKGTYIPAAVCAAAGAGIGVLIQDQRSGTSTVTVRNPDGTLHTISESDDKELWKGALVGAPIGAIVCGLLGHAIFDKEMEAAPPSPPPPPIPAPTPEALPVPAGKRIVLRGVQFDFNKSEIRLDSRSVLNEAVEILKENPGVHISIAGHTDAIGGDAYNEQLSLQRAEAVFRYLVNHGIAPERMDVVGYGKRFPVADNDTESGRAQNRRVELRVMGTARESEQRP